MRRWTCLKREGRAYEHEHINKHTMKWEGKEVDGLVAPHKHRPDGVARDTVCVRVFFVDHTQRIPRLSARAPV